MTEGGGALPPSVIASGTARARVAIPWLLRRMERRFHTEREIEPYVNTATSLVIAGLLVLVGYSISRPLVALSRLPTRGGMPLAMGLILVSLFILVSRKKAITQVIGFPLRTSHRSGSARRRKTRFSVG